jgi:hypothetical protein
MLGRNPFHRRLLAQETCGFGWASDEKTDLVPILLPRQSDRLRLTSEERLLMQCAASEIGRCTIEDLATRAMLEVASRALGLKNRGLARADIQFSKDAPGQPVRVTVELTDLGKRVLEETS